MLDRPTLSLLLGRMPHGSGSSCCKRTGVQAFDRFFHTSIVDLLHIQPSYTFSTGLSNRSAAIQQHSPGMCTHPMHPGMYSLSIWLGHLVKAAQIAGPAWHTTLTPLQLPTECQCHIEGLRTPSRCWRPCHMQHCLDPQTSAARAALKTSGNIRVPLCLGCLNISPDCACLRNHRTHTRAHGCVPHLPDCSVQTPSCLHGDCSQWHAEALLCNGATQLLAVSLTPHPVLT
jgi:hypothetical protein